MDGYHALIKERPGSKNQQVGDSGALETMER